MNKVTYILTRILFIAIIIIAGGVFHEYLLYPDIKQNEGWLQEMTEKRLNEKPDVIYMSSSPNQALGPDDTDRRFISQMISDSISLKLKAIDTGAIHAGIYYQILNKIPKEKYPSVLVVNLNIRSHGNNWIHSDLENSLQRNMLYWNDNPGIVNHLIASLKYYDYKSPVEHQRAIEYAEKFAELPFGGSHKTIKKWCDSLFLATKDSEEGITMIKHFGFLIDENNIQLARFDKIAEWTRKNNIELIYVILPENIQKMERLAGKDLRDLVGKNADFLYRRYTKKGVKVINLWDKADENIFFESFPTEHYRSPGRAVVASEVAKAINEISTK